MKQKVVMVWSGGKDSSLALHQLMNDKHFEVCHLMTSVNKTTQRVSMHGVKKDLILAQAKSIGLSVSFVEYEEASYEAYETAMADEIRKFQSQGVNTFAFGDINLEDLRIYREKQFEKLGAKVIFPLWKENTKRLVSKFIALNFKSIVCCIDASKLESKQLGGVIDHKWLNSLADLVDPCGENGEFHTFCFDGPIFKYPIEIKLGNRLLKEYHHDGQVSRFEFVDLDSV